MFARFWWGHLVINPKFTGALGLACVVKKDDGGLGFCDLHIFNQAILAKQSWRIIKIPNSLLAKVL